MFKYIPLFISLQICCATVFAQDLSAHLPHQILGVSPQASHTEINKAWKKLVFKLHPDRNPENIKESEALLIKINNAREALLKRPKTSSVFDTGDTPSEFQSFATRNPDYNAEDMAKQFFKTIHARGIYERLPQGELKDFILTLNQTSPWSVSSWQKNSFSLKDLILYLDYVVSKNRQVDIQTHTQNFLTEIFDTQIDSIESFTNTPLSLYRYEHLFFEFWIYLETDFYSQLLAMKDKEHILSTTLKYLITHSFDFNFPVFLQNYHDFRNTYDLQEDPFASLKPMFQPLVSRKECFHFLNENIL